MLGYKRVKLYDVEPQNPLPVILVILYTSGEVSSMLWRKKFIFPLSFLATTNDIIWVCKWQLWQQLSLKLWSYLRGANNRWWNWKVVALLNSLQGIGRFSIKSMKQDISGPLWRDNKANITLWDVTKYFLESTLISDRPDSNLLAELKEVP